MTATTLRSFVKDPYSTLPFSIDWTAWLADLTGETIDTAVWTVEYPIDPAPTLTIESSSISGAVCTVILSDGEDGTDYIVQCRITTTPSLYVDDRSITIQARDR